MGTHKYSREMFINKANRKHNFVYDYSKVDYINSQTKVCITCQVHGDFLQTPADHLRGVGCPKCATERVSKSRIKKVEDFINESNSIHHGKYLYNKVVYESSKKKVIVTCPIHGDFYVRPNNHLNGSGCPRCYAEETTQRQTKDYIWFIKKAKNVHGDKYNYSLVDYSKSNEKVKIICPKHGIFEQEAASHLRGVGCPHCKKSNGEEIINNFLVIKGLDFIRQHTVKNDYIFCKNIEFKIDFYIPSKKMFIEYNGLQHYKPVNHFGGKEAFLKQKERDLALKIYCKEHKIRLLEIPYYEQDNIDNILNNAF